MARQFGFSYVSDESFAAFNTELESGSWHLVPGPDAKLLVESPVLVILKTRLTIAVKEMLTAMGVYNKVVEPTKEWDRLQTRLAARVAYDETDAQPEHRAMAARVRERLLRAKGKDPTKLETDAKVDFGRAQVLQAEHKSLASDLAALGYKPLLKAIGQATHNLAVVAGREGDHRPTVPSVLLREARITCVTAFNAVTNTLDFLLTQTPVHKSQRKLLTELRASLQALLDHHVPVAETAPESTPHSS